MASGERSRPRVGAQALGTRPAAIHLIVSGEFHVDASGLTRLRGAAPDIGSITTVSGTAEMCAAAARGLGPAVGIISGDRPTGGMATTARKFAVGALAGGLVVIDTGEKTDTVADALLQGVKGWVLTESPAEELLTAIRAVAAGHLFVPSALLHELADTILVLNGQRQAKDEGGELTSRELDVLRLLALGTPNSEMADRLFITEATVHSHVLNILRKLKARNRTEAVAMVYRGRVRQARPIASV